MTHGSSFGRRALFVAVIVAMVPAHAAAGGFYLLERQGRALGRGGAFVAGADDPGALHFNPAGLAFAPPSLLVDATFTPFGVDFTRRIGDETLPTVHGQAAPVPIPTIAGTFDLGVPNVMFGAGLFAPNAAQMTWPDQVDVGGQQLAAPQRYSVLSLEGSLITSLTVGAAWRPIPELSIGIAPALVFGSLATRTTLSSCDGIICAFPEDPEYDAVSQLSLNPLFSFTLAAGITYDAGPVRLGASVTTPYALDGTGHINVRPPGAASFDGAFTRSREGSCGAVSDEEIAMSIERGARHRCQDARADVNVPFPWVVRVGAELRAIEHLRIEAAVVWETWSVQQQISIRPRDVWFADSVGFLDYQIGEISIPRRMHDTISVRLGGELDVIPEVTVRAGGYYESSSFDDTMLNALLVDSDKVVFGVGASIELTRGLVLDVNAGYGHLFARDVTTSQLTAQNPIRPAAGDAPPIGNGTYSMTAPFGGLGIRWFPGGARELVPRATSSEEEETPVIIERADPAPVDVEAAPVEDPIVEPETTEPAVEEPPPEAPANEPDARPWYQRRRRSRSR